MRKPANRKKASDHREYLGEFEIVVLATMVRLGPDAYGVSIKSEIELLTERYVSLGALYATLSRLERKGYVLSRVGAATAERGGRAKRHYKVLSSGRSQLERSLTSLYRLTEGTGLWVAT